MPSTASAQKPTILVTGANRGLGLEFVRAYSNAGWRVIGVVRDALSGRAASEAGAEVYVGDLADYRSLERLHQSLANVKFDILLLNAGIYGESQAFGAMDYDEAVKVYKINTLGPLKMAELFAAQLTGPKILAGMSSMMASMTDNSSGRFYSYRASKAALNAVLKSLSIDLAPDGVTVLSLSPGWARTDMGGENAPLSAEEAALGLKAVMDKAGPAHSGKFWHYDGSELPW